MAGNVIYDGASQGIALPEVVNLPSSASVGQVLKVGAGNVLEYGAGGGGGIAIGDPVTGALDFALLYTDGSDELAQNAGFYVEPGNTNALHVAITNKSRSSLAAGSDGGLDIARAVTYAHAAGKVDAEISLQALADGDASAYFAADDYNSEFTLGLDKSAAKFVLSLGSALGTTDVFTANGTTFEVVDILNVSGGIELADKTITVADTPYTVLATDITLLVDTSGGAVTATLPAAPTDGMLVNIKKITTDATAMTIGRNGKSIEGAAADIVTTAANRPNYQLQYNASANTWWIL